MLLCYYGGSGDDDRHISSHSTSFASQEDLREAIVAVCDPTILFDHFAAEACEIQSLSGFLLRSTVVSVSIRHLARGCFVGKKTLCHLRP